MEKIINAVRRPAPIVAISALSVAVLCALLRHAGTFPNGFMPVLGHLFIMILQLGIIGGLLFCVIFKQNKILRYALPALFAWWLLSSTFDKLGDSVLAQSAFDGLTIAIGVFGFLVGLALLAALALLVVAHVKEDGKLRNVAFFVLYGSLLFVFVLFVLELSSCGVAEAPWTGYFGVFADFAWPVGLLFAYFPLAFGDAQPAPEPQEEPAEQEADEQEPAAE